MVCHNFFFLFSFIYINRNRFEKLAAKMNKANMISFKKNVIKSSFPN